MTNMILCKAWQFIKYEMISVETDMCEFESSQKDDSTAQSADSSKACRKPRVFNC